MSANPWKTATEWLELVCKAAKEGDAAEFRRLRAQFKELSWNWRMMNSRWPQGKIPIILASKAGHADIVQACLDAGDSVHISTLKGLPPLLVAIRKGHLDVVNVLLAAGADMDARDRKDSDALGIAVSGGHLHIVQALIAAGCKLNSKDCEGDNALHKAARKANVAILEALLAAGADFTAADSEGRSPLSWATSRVQAVQKFLKVGAPVDASALAAAASGNRRKSLEVLMAAAGPGLTRIPAVAAAASWGNLESVKLLLSVGLSASAADDQGRTPLMLASSSYSVASVEVLKTLLAAGASVDERDSQAQTALMYAAAKANNINCTGILRALTASGANVNARDNWGRTVLHILVTAHPSYQLRALHELLTAGADVNAPDSEGVTPLMAAIKGGNIPAAGLLMESGADLHAVDSCGNTPAFMAAITLMFGTTQALQYPRAHMAPSGVLAEMFRASKQNVLTLMELGAGRRPPGLIDRKAMIAAGVPCLQLLAMYVSAWEHKSYGSWWRPRPDLDLLRAAGSDMPAASQTYPTPLDAMLLWNGLDWLQWRHNTPYILNIIKELAAAGCPVDTRLPARGEAGSLQPSTLETWLATLAEHGWPVSQDVADRALAVSQALLECAAAQGSKGRPELLAAAKAVGSPELVAAVQTVLPLQDPPLIQRATRKGKGRSRAPNEDATRATAVAAVPGHPPPRPLPAAVRWGMKPALVGATRSRMSWHVRYTAGSRLLARLAV